MNLWRIIALAARRIALRPVRFALVGIAICLLTATSASSVLFGAAVQQSMDRVLSKGPSLVASRVDAGGWASIDVADVERLVPIPGVVQVHPRVWGVLPGPPAVTVMADPDLRNSSDAVAGRGVAGARAGEILALRALDGSVEEVRVGRILDHRTDPAAFDVVWVGAEVARRLLLLPEGRATDFAITSVRSEEDDALVPEIAAALDYPVRITTRAQMRGAYLTQVGRLSGANLAALFPALLALTLIVGLTASGGPEAPRDVGRLKLMGWSTREVAALHVAETTLVASLSILCGLTLAYIGVFVSGAGAALGSLLGWSGSPPHLHLDADAVLLSFVQVGSLIVAPVLVAALIPSIRLARADPADLLEGP